MPSLTADVRWHEVPFAGARTVTAPLTWGQVLVERDIRRMPAGTPYNVTVPVLVPDGVPVSGVLDAVRVLIGRFEALRTVFPDQAGRLVQRVLAAGTARVGEWAGPAAAATFAAGAQELDQQLEASTFDHRGDLPVRFLLCTQDGAPRALLLCIAHLVADLQSTRLAAEALTRLLQGRAAGLADTPDPGQVQPADLAAFEASVRGRRVSAAAVAHLRRQLQAVPMDNFAPERAVAAAEPRFWRGTLESPVSGPALGMLAARYGASSATIALAVTAAVLGAVTGAPRCGLLLVTGNRTTPELRESVGTLTQHMPTVIDVTGPYFADLVRAAWAAAMRAFRHGRFDPVDGWAALADVSKERGGEPEIRCFFNDMRGIRAPAAPAGPLDPSLVEQARNRPQLRWTERRPAGSSFFMEVGDVLHQPGQLRWTLLADTALLPPETIHAVLAGIDRLLLALLEADLPVATLAGIAGLTPAGSRPAA